jgi:hypothetical protein
VTHPAEWDVIVCGGGTAGVAAAISASRQGAQTLVVEQFGSLGGTQTNAWVTPMMPNYIGDFKLSRGISIEIMDELAKVVPPGGLDHGDDWYDPAALALILDQLTQQAGVTCLFNATIIGAKTSNRRVTEVEVATRAGRQWLKGKSFIDSTGDGELAMYAGAELMAGDGTGVHQPMTLRFTMGGIDMQRARASLKPYLRMNLPEYMELGYHEAKESPMKDLVCQAIKAKTLEEDDLGYFQLFSVNGRTGEFAFNAPRIAGLDPLDPFELSRAYQLGRAKIYRIAEFMKLTFDGFQNAYVSVVAPLMGIRESRRVVGEYILTEEDHMACRKFEDAVAHNRYPIDIHLKQGTDYRTFPPGEYHDVPYRSLVIRGFENFWVAGRCLSATFVAQSSVRIQSVCRSMGEAAGIAAAICAKRGLKAMEVPYQDLAANLDLSVPTEPA